MPHATLALNWQTMCLSTQSEYYAPLGQFKVTDRYAQNKCVGFRGNPDGVGRFVEERNRILSAESSAVALTSNYRPHLPARERFRTRSMKESAVEVDQHYKPSFVVRLLPKVSMSIGNGNVYTGSRLATDL